MKRFIKNIIWDYCSNDILELKKIVSRFDYVSFDVFDTLITRNVISPTDIFEQVEIIANCKCHLGFNFKQKRIEAERIARDHATYEINIDDIYFRLYELTQTDCEELKNLEVDIEKKFIQARKNIKDLYNFCIQQNKKIYIISDMYLYTRDIVDMLHKCGYYNWEKIYVSSETKVTKRNGDLFDKVLADNGIKRNEIIHIGDSIIVDYITARRHGFKSSLIRNDRYPLFFDRRNETRMEKSDIPTYQILSSFINNNCAGKEIEYIIGYEVLGPLLYSYCKWLFQNSQGKDLYFMAREGAMLKKAFSIMYPNYKTYYLHTSRRSIAYTELINAKSISDIKRILPLKRTEDIQGFLELLRIDEDFSEMLLQKFCLNKKHSIECLPDDIFYELKERIQKKSTEQRRLLIKYFEQNNFKGEVIISDIGWRGTTQHYIEKICNSEFGTKVNITGYYLGLLKDSKYREFQLDEKKGFLFDYYNNNYLADIFSVSRMACELLFMPTEGSTIGYYEKDGLVFPELAESEFNNKEKKIIEKVQSAALDFIMDINESGIKTFLNLSPSIYAANYIKYGVRPNKESLDFINCFSYTEAGNVLSYKTEPFYIYCFKPLNITKDFSNTAWKTGFMREFFCLDLPYYKLLIKMRQRDQLNNDKGK